MKNILKTILYLVLIFSAFDGLSQNLAFTDLVYLLEHNVEDADTYITNKGFQYHEVKKTENINCDIIVWSFNRNIGNNSALSFIAKHCYKSSFGFIWYQLELGDRPTFNKIKDYCKAMEFSLVKAETNPFNDLCTTFEGTKYKIEFCSGLDEGTNKNSYNITIKIK